MPKERQIKETCFLNDAEFPVSTSGKRGKYTPQAGGGGVEENGSQLAENSEEETNGTRSWLQWLSSGKDKNKPGQIKGR